MWQDQLASAIEFALFHFLAVSTVNFVRAFNWILFVFGCAIAFHFCFLNSKTCSHEGIVIMPVSAGRAIFLRIHEVAQSTPHFQWSKSHGQGVPDRSFGL